MNANFASLMPQVIGVWCEEEGHEITYVCYTGKENLLEELPQFYSNIIKNDLCHLYELLPAGAVFHDQNAYLKKDLKKVAV